MVASITQSRPSSSVAELYQDHRVAYIGHGQLESAPENFSALHVISHELGHAQEFRNQASRDHADIRSLDVKIHYEMRNGKMVAVSGETSVTSVKKEEEALKKEYQPYTSGTSMTDFLKAQTEAKLADPRRINEIEKKEELENKIKSIEDLLQAESKFSIAPEKKETEDKFSSKEKSDFYKEEMVREKKRLEEEVRLLKMQEETRKTFAMLTDIQKSMLANVFGMMQMGQETKSGSLLEAFI